MNSDVPRLITPGIALVLVLALVVPVADCDAQGHSTYASPDGEYDYVTSGSGSDSSPYRCEILGFRSVAGTVFLQSAVEGYPVTRIASLEGCNASTLVIPDTVEEVADGALAGCTGLERLVFLGDRPEGDLGGCEVVAIDGTSGWGDAASIPAGTLVSGDSVFRYFVLDGDAFVLGLQSGTDVAIPYDDGEGHVFRGVVPEAFRETGVRSVALGDGIASIGTRAFYKCSQLQTVEGGSVVHIRDEAFRACTALAGYDLDGVRTIGFESFRNCESMGSIDVPDSVVSMGDGAFYICRAAATVSVGSGVSEIPGRAFGYCETLTDVNLDGADAIGASAFINCTGLASASLEGVRAIGPNAFSGCKHLSQVDLGESLGEIGDSAFSECRSLVEVTMPASLGSMGKGVFFHCINLEDVFFEGTMPSHDGDILYGTQDVAVHVTAGNADSWGGFEGNLIVEADGGSGGPDPAIAACVAVLVVAALASAVLIRSRRRKGND